MQRPTIARTLSIAQRTLTWWMVTAYFAALLLPEVGIMIRRITLSTDMLPGLPAVRVGLSTLLLAFVLFTAALQVPTGTLPALVRKPLPLLIGTVANIAVPLALLPALSAALRFAPDADGGSGLLTGMAIVGAMPVAGGATVWGSRAGSNRTLIVGIVLTSTLLSPLTIPLTLSAASALAHGHYAHDLARMAGTGGGSYAGVSVAVPCLVGLAVQKLAADHRLARALPSLRLAALAGSLLLTYTNACGALVGQLAHPQPVFIAASIAVAAAVCTASLVIGWGLARAARTAPPDVLSITLASGMNNSSASAVLAATQLPSHPQVLMPVLAYSLVQKIGAGAADALAFRGQQHGPARR